MTAPNAQAECCPPFDPEPWRDREIVWDGKRFVQDRVRSILHMPLNFGAVMTRNMQRIEASGAKLANGLVLSGENSAWGADVFIEVAKPVPGARMATLSGTFLSKVFEGPYGKIGGWVKEALADAAAKGKKVQQVYFCYPTCPKCARKYGKNHVVILARI